jgi:hypothetical protein
LERSYKIIEIDQSINFPVDHPPRLGMYIHMVTLRDLFGQATLDDADVIGLISENEYQADTLRRSLPWGKVYDKI